MNKTKYETKQNKTKQNKTKHNITKLNKKIKFKNIEHIRTACSTLSIRYLIIFIIKYLKIKQSR